MSWFYNVDYENFLFSGRANYSFTSSKINQEFEFLINFFEDDPVIHTHKLYNERYKEKIEALSGKKFSTSTDPSLARPWCCPIGGIEKDQRIHSKATSSRLALEKGWEEESKIVTIKNFSPAPGRLYKTEGGFSGRGHLLWPRDEAAILKLLEKGALLIEEPLRTRSLDFSALVLGPGQRRLYVNLVDERFQYKGTLLEEPVLNAKTRDRYEEILDELEREYLAIGADYPFSVDSYLYLKDGRERLCAVSEVNARKTMGYIAAGLEKHFLFRKGAFCLMPKEAALTIPKNAMALSPADSMFKACFLDAEDRESKAFLEAFYFPKARD